MAPHSLAISLIATLSREELGINCTVVLKQRRKKFGNNHISKNCQSNSDDGNHNRNDNNNNCTIIIVTHVSQNCQKQPTLFTII